MEKDQNISFLEWHLESGVYALLEEKPQNFLASDQEKTIKLDKTADNQALNKPSIIYPKIDDCNSLRDLKEAIFEFDGGNIKKSAKNIVFGAGKIRSKLMLIGEAPGEEEDNSGEPFVGAAGKLLDKMLNSIDIIRSETYITNIIPWRPPGNRKPSLDEIEAFKPFIHKHIDLVNPMIIILIGGTAASTILENDLGITKLRGKWHEYKGIDVMPIYHPAYLLRQPSQKKQAWEDLLKIKKKITSL